MRIDIGRWKRVAVATVLVALSTSCSGSVGEAPPGMTQVTVSPPAIDYGEVLIGQIKTQTVLLKNSGSGTVTVTQANTGGSDFSNSGLALPLTLAEGESATLAVVFSPFSGGEKFGSVTFFSDASNSPTTLSLSGTGAVASIPGQLILFPASIDFGDLTLGSSSSAEVTLSNSGSNVILVASANVIGANFSLDALALPVNLSSGEALTINVIFSPSAAGSTTGWISFTNDGLSSPTILLLTGTGIEFRTVSLAWDPSPSEINGFNVYRRTSSGSSFERVNQLLVTETAFLDNTAISGISYLYAVTAVDPLGVESVFSNEAPAP